MAAIPPVGSTSALSGVQINKQVLGPSSSSLDEEATSKRGRLDSAGAALQGPAPDPLVQLLKDTVAQCAYGKDMEKLLAPWHQFEVSTNSDGDQLLLKNYTDPAGTKPPFKGECSELAYMVGAYVQKLIGRQYRNDQAYTIRAAEGSCADYFADGSHIYLLLWPKQKNETMKVHLDRVPCPVPNDCFLVDPSFKRVLLPGKDIAERGRYTLNKVAPLSRIEPPSVSAYAYPDVISLPRGFPVGYVDDVLAENQRARWSRSPDAFLFWGVEEGAPPRVVFHIAPSPESTELSEEDDMVQALPDEHVLKRLWTKVTSDLAASWGKHFSSSLMDTLPKQAQSEQAQ